MESHRGVGALLYSELSVSVHTLSVDHLAIWKTTHQVKQEIRWVSGWWNIGVHWRRRQLTDTDLNELHRLLRLWLCWGKSGPNCPSLRLPLLHTHTLSPLLHTHTVSHTQNVVAMHAQTCRYASDPHG